VNLVGTKRIAPVAVVRRRNTSAAAVRRAPAAFSRRR
jgi:hypothetical protein